MTRPPCYSEHVSQATSGLVPRFSFPHEVPCTLASAYMHHEMRGKWTEAFWLHILQRSYSHMPRIVDGEFNYFQLAFPFSLYGQTQEGRHGMLKGRCEMEQYSQSKNVSLPINDFIPARSTEGSPSPVRSSLDRLIVVCPSYSINLFMKASYFKMPRFSHLSV